MFATVIFFLPLNSYPMLGYPISHIVHLVYDCNSQGKIGIWNWNFLQEWQDLKMLYLG